MKNYRIFPFLLALCLLLTGCRGANNDISRQQIIDAYEAAGYRVSSRVYASPVEFGQVAYVRADQPDGDQYVYFTFFDTEENARAYAKTKDHPVMLSMFSLIYGQPQWLRVQCYGSIVVEYWDSQLMRPFRQLQSA